MIGAGKKWSVKDKELESGWKLIIWDQGNGTIIWHFLLWGFPVRKITNCLAGLSQQAQQISWDKEEGEEHGCYSTALTEICQALQVFPLKIEVQGDYSLQLQITNVIVLERNYGSLVKFHLAIHIP